MHKLCLNSLRSGENVGDPLDASPLGQRRTRQSRASTGAAPRGAISVSPWSLGLARCQSWKVACWTSNIAMFGDLFFWTIQRSGCTVRAGGSSTPWGRSASKTAASTRRLPVPETRRASSLGTIHRVRRQILGFVGLCPLAAGLSSLPRREEDQRVDGPLDLPAVSFFPGASGPSDQERSLDECDLHSGLKDAREGGDHVGRHLGPGTRDDLVRGQRRGRT